MYECMHLKGKEHFIHITVIPFYLKNKITSISSNILEVSHFKLFIKNMFHSSFSESGSNCYIWIHVPLNSIVLKLVVGTPFPVSLML